MRLFWILLLAFGALSCQQKNQVVVNKILIDRAEGADGVFPDRNQLRAWVKSSLISHANFKFDEDASNGSTLRVRVGASPFASNGDPRRVFIATQLLKEDKGVAQQWQAESSIDISLSDLQPAFKKGLAENLDSISSELMGPTNSNASASQILKDYVNGTAMPEGEVATAIRKVAQEKDESAKPFLKRLLKGRNLRLSVQALQALATLGASDSIDAITDFAERKSPELRRHAIEAARRIGGQHAAAWLFTLSTGHSDEQVRESARLALIDVERRLNLSTSGSSSRSKEVIAKN